MIDFRFALRKSIVLFVAVAFLTGCKLGVSLVYNQADWYVERRANDLLDFNRKRREDLHREVKLFFAEHRKTELPLIAYYLNTTADLISRSSPTAAKIENSLKDVENLFKRTASLATPGASRILSSLNTHELETFRKNITARNAEQLEELTSLSLKDWRSQRMKSFLRAFKFLSGSASQEQEQLISAWIERSDYSKRLLWIQNRQDQQNHLIELIQNKASKEDIEMFLNDWIFRAEKSRSKEYIGFLINERTRFHTLILDLSLSLSPKQKRHFADTLKDLSESLMES